MKVEKLYEILGKLRCLAEDPRTPTEESNNARRRMDEIEAKICRIAKEKIVKENISVFDALRTKRKNLSNKRTFETEFPFGWNKTIVLSDFKRTFDKNKNIVLEWKCPGCGMCVERIITVRHQAKLRGKINGVELFINGIREGKLNQLCDNCWNTYS